MRRVYLDLQGLDAWHGREIADRLSQSAEYATRVTFASSAAESDLILAFVPDARPARGADTAGAPRYFWLGEDRPSGLHAGLYCSLPRFLFRDEYHDSFCYPLKYNELIEPFDGSDARLLFSFVGGLTSGVRHRLFRALANRGCGGEVRESAGPWTSMFDRSGTEVKRSYAESIRRAKFVLCPRGNGVGSVRLFEVMEARRVPVVISDSYVWPRGVDWARCSVRVPEAAVSRIPEILAQHGSEWETMAELARLEWERHFGPSALLDGMVDRLSRLRPARPPGQSARLTVFRMCQRLRKQAGAARRFFA